ncbi:glycosyltransferase [Streptococcus hongkongensis]|nr:hypothetical protein NC01_04440 [Streptococcus uberis]
MKNILFISPTGTLENGAEIAITNLMGYLNETGYKVFNVFPKNADATYPAYLERMEQFNVKSFSLETLNWWWEESPGVLHGNHEKRSIFYLYNIKQIRQIIVEQKIDVVISNTVNVFQGAIAAAAEKTPHLWLIHENPAEEFEYYKEKFQFIVSQSNKVFAASKKLSESLNNSFSPLEPVQSFIPYSKINDFSLQHSNTRRIVSIGKINENKNQMELLMAYYQLNRPEIPLIFIGGWEEETKFAMDSFIREHSLNSVQFLGNQREPWQYVTDADICVLNSKMEVFSLSLVESILNGIPTIFSSNPGYLSVSDFFGLSSCYSLGNVDELTSYMSCLLDNFTVEKENSLQVAVKARKRYQLDLVYKSIIDEIENVDKPKSNLDAISFLLGDTVNEEILYHINRKQITIYFETKLKTFCNTNSQIFDLDKEGEITFLMPKDTQRVRIDLGEDTGIYNNLKLVALEKCTEILPRWTNGVIYQDNYVFLKTDPQIIYDVRHWNSQELLFKYRSLDINNFANNEEDEKNLLDIVEQVQSRFFRFEQLNNEKLELEEALKATIDRYHSVISSRRWKILTKIINAIRRKT